MAETLLIDLSAHDSSIVASDFKTLYERGCRGLISRLSRGPEVDDTATGFTLLGKDHNFLVGGYHYLEGGDLNGTDQAETYLSNAVVAALDFHALDVEAAGIKWQHVLGFVERLRREGLLVGLYTRDSYWSARAGFRDDIFDWQWRADYRTEIGGGTRRLSNWSSPDGANPPARLWQFGALKIGDKSVDGNVFQGVQSEFERYIHATLV